MDNAILLKIITPTTLALECSAALVTLPGEQGVFGVLPNHAPLLASLNSGIIQITTDAKIQLKYFTYNGIAQVTSKEINILSEFIVELSTVQKTEIIEQINALSKKIEENLNATDATIINENLQKYQSLLACLD